MEILKQIWALLNGNKTLIGVLLLKVILPHVEQGSLLFDLCEYLGNILAYGGAAHKAVKWGVAIKDKLSVEKPKG